MRQTRFTFLLGPEGMFIGVGTLFGVVLGTLIAPMVPSSKETTKTLDRNLVAIAIQSSVRLNVGEAKYDLVEFFDYQCPACRHSAVAVSGLVKKLKIGYVIAHFPLPMHKSAMSAARSMIAASTFGIERDLHTWLVTANDISSTAIAKEAALLGVALGKWQARVHDPKTQASAEMSLEVAGKLDLVGTPTFAVQTPKGNTIAFINVQETLEFIANAKVSPPWPWGP